MVSNKPHVVSSIFVFTWFVAILLGFSTLFSASVGKMHPDFGPRRCGISVLWWYYVVYVCHFAFVFMGLIVTSFAFTTITIIHHYCAKNSDLEIQPGMKNRTFVAFLCLLIYTVSWGLYYLVVGLQMNNPQDGTPSILTRLPLPKRAMFSFLFPDAGIPLALLSFSRDVHDVVLGRPPRNLEFKPEVSVEFADLSSHHPHYSCNATGRTSCSGCGAVVARTPFPVDMGGRGSRFLMQRYDGAVMSPYEGPVVTTSCGITLPNHSELAYDKSRESYPRERNI
jgi:hypothetical protein